eukprot:TRINITY_DN13903_c0_g1_i2.p1 TRINITY_DN13903_c0_g1~~TRINITY_DN13903_c0_g1_i2.p1  ORF type:complete len:711 (-),score=203.45 TRINITY_DN13903_c0_g1_i2:167-2299(-)
MPAARAVSVEGVRRASSVRRLAAPLTTVPGRTRCAGGPPAERPASARGGRFTAEEQRAFGHRQFGTVLSRRPSRVYHAGAKCHRETGPYSAPASQDGQPQPQLLVRKRSSSMQRLADEPPRAPPRLTLSRRPTMESPTRARCGLPRGPELDAEPLDLELPVKAVLTRMLPSKQLGQRPPRAPDDASAGELAVKRSLTGSRQPSRETCGAAARPEPERERAASLSRQASRESGGAEGRPATSANSSSIAKQLSLHFAEQPAAPGADDPSATVNVGADAGAPATDGAPALEPPPPPSDEEAAAILERFRRKLLKHHRSVHEAFAKFDASMEKDRSLSLEEFRRSAAKINVVKDVDLIFTLIDADGSGTVSTNEWLAALVGTSPDALLWELRCGLDKHGIRFSNAHKAFELIRHHDLQKKRLNLDDKDIRDSLLDVGEVRQNLRLRRNDWLKFGLTLGLSIPCTERLFEIVDRDQSGAVDLPEMFEALRATAPDVSLEGFVTKVLVRYGSLQEAFKQHACDDLLGRDEFLELAKALEVKDQNALELWSRARDQEGIARRQDSGGADLMREEEFVQQLRIWAPETALDSLREQMREQFGSVRGGQMALLQAGTVQDEVLSVAELESLFRRVNIRHCDAALVLGVVATMRGDACPGDFQGITLEDVVCALRRRGRARRSKGLRSSSPLEVVASAMGPYWQQLNAIKNEIRHGLAT